MRNRIRIYLSSLLATVVTLSSFAPVLAAYNDVQFTTDMTMTVSDYSLTVLTSGDLEQLEVGSTTFTVTLGGGSSIIIRSADKVTFSASPNVNQTDCQSTYSQLFLDSSMRTGAITVTVSGTTCSTAGSGGGGGGSDPAPTPAPSSGGGGGGSATVTTPAPVTTPTVTPETTTPVVTTPVVSTPVTPVVTSMESVPLNPDSTVMFSGLPAKPFQPGSTLGFTYRYTNGSKAAMPIKIVRQLLTSKGKVVKSSSAVTTLSPGATFKRTVKDLLSGVAPGAYKARVAIYNAKTNKLIDENSFMITVEKAKKKTFVLGEVANMDGDVMFDAAAIKAIKSNVALPVTPKFKYSYHNSTSQPHTVRMIRQVLDSKGKVVFMSTGRWQMKPGEKDSMSFTQPITPSYAAGSYTLSIQAYDYTSKYLLAENSVGFTVGMK